jgi:hypothetical protein
MMIKNHLRMKRDEITINIQTESHFFELLPQDLFRHFLTYLSFYEIGTFDNSMTNHVLRPLYLNSIKGMVLTEIKNGEGCQETEELYYDWMVSRDVYAKSLNLFCFFGDEEKIIDRCRPFLESFFIYSDEIDYNHLGHPPPFHVGFLPKLDCITLGLQSVTDGDLETMLELNPQIKTLDLYCMYMLTEKSLSTIAVHCPHLRQLRLERNKFVTDESINKLLQGRLNLVSLDISCTSVAKHESIVKILSAFPNLKHISGNFSIQPIKTSMMMLKEINLPSLMANDREIQLLSAKTFIRYLEGDPFIRGVVALFQVRDVARDVQGLVDMGAISHFADLLDQTSDHV